jgi:hypothetical protein
MRKISHWKLAKHLAEKHGKCTFRFTFKLGSVLPDILVHTYWKGHTFDATIDAFCRKLARLEEKGRYSMVTGLRLGYAIHFLEDYFTLPHNTNFLGNLREHCAYEKCQQVEFLRRLKVVHQERHERVRSCLYEGKQELSEALKRMHEDYLKEIPSVDTDCRYIMAATELLRDHLFPKFAGNA